MLGRWRRPFICFSFFVSLSGRAPLPRVSPWAIIHRAYSPDKSGARLRPVGASLKGAHKGRPYEAAYGVYSSIIRMNYGNKK